MPAWAYPMILRQLTAQLTAQITGPVRPVAHPPVLTAAPFPIRYPWTPPTRGN